MHQIRKGIIYEDSFMGVTLGGLAFPHGIIYIDAPLRMEDIRLWRSTLSGQRGGVHRLLINLDAHPDRTLGARAFDCTVVSHQKTAQVFRNRPTIFKGQTIATGAAWEDFNDAIGIRWIPPDITFTNTMSFFWGGPEIILEHRPGPTPGASWILIPSEKVAFIGDALLVGQPPFLANADITTWLEALELISTAYSDFFLVAGRGGAASIDTVHAMQQGLKNTSKGLEKLAKRHASPEHTEDLIPGLMEDFAVPREEQSHYHQRLRFGLYQYYTRRYRSSASSESLRAEEGEQ
jgi:glyoxylase-like metal-dependent hydrolase (beta-lactamase superfamily II)